MQELPGLLFHWGCADALASTKALQTPGFDIDEQALEIGVRILARSAIMACQGDTCSQREAKGSD